MISAILDTLLGGVLAIGGAFGAGVWTEHVRTRRDRTNREMDLLLSVHEDLVNLRSAIMMIASRREGEPVRESGIDLLAQDARFRARLYRLTDDRARELALVASKDLEQALRGLAPSSQDPPKVSRDEAQKRLDKAEASIEAYAARMGERSRELG
jgi:hypothetical protein